MKKYRFLLLLFVLGFIYMGCEENDIDVYDETPRLNLYYGNLSVYFSFSASGMASVTSTSAFCL